MKARLHGLTIAYDDEGNGLPLVLLHGFPLSRAMWSPQVAPLVQRGRYRVIRPDLRGFGESDIIAKPAEMSHLAEDTLALLDHLNIESFVLGGLSMGGYVALAIYSARPQAVRALILATTHPYADTPQGKVMREMMAQIAEQEGPATIVTWVDHLFPREIDTPVELRERVRQIVRSNNPHGIAAAARGMALRPDSQALLRTITCPTLIVTGALDQYASEETLQMMT